MRNAPYLLCLTAAIGLTFACRASNDSSSEQISPEAAEMALTSDQEENAIASGIVEASATSQDSSQLRADMEELSLIEQRKAYMREQYVARSRDLMSDLRLDEALVQAAHALELDEDNLESKSLVAEINTLMGRPAGEIETISAVLERDHAVRVQQLRADAAEALRKGKVNLAQGEYDKAIAELTIAVNHVKWAPYSIDWNGVDRESQNLLERAKHDRELAAEHDRQTKREAAYKQLKDEQQADGERDAAIVATMLDRAIDAFQEQRYDDAIEYSDAALLNSPHESRAMQLREAAFRAGRQKARADYVEDRREQFASWKEEIAELRVPWTGVITVPDAERWAELSAMRGERPGLDLTQSVDPGVLELRKILDNTQVPALVIEESESLIDVMATVRAITGLPIVVHAAAENAALDNSVIYEINFTNPLTSTQVFDLVADQSGEDVTWTIRDDAVIFTTKEKARNEPIIVNHDVQDLVFGLTDFLGPRIDRIRLLDELEDDDGGGPFGFVSERVKMIEEDDLSTLIQENVAVGTWEDEGIFIDVGEGYILVVHTPEVQGQVGSFLEDLRRSAGSLVTIESRFITVSDNWLQELGVDFRGLDNATLPDVTNGLEDMSSLGLDNSGTGSQGQNAAGSPSAGAFYDDGGDGAFLATTQNFFGAALGSAVSNVGGLTFQLSFLDDLQVSAILRAVEKSQHLELVNSQVLSVHNTQRAYVAVINQKAFIQDFDVEVAQFQAVADPQVNVLTEGVVLDVRPIIQHDRKYLTLEIQPTVAKVVNLRNFASTLGGNTSPVEFQLPELEVQSVFTTAVIPDGGSILLGGLSKVRNIERRAEVPWIAKIPLIGFLFKEEGYSDEKESLKILISATITDIRDEVGKL